MSKPMVTLPAKLVVAALGRQGAPRDPNQAGANDLGMLCRREVLKRAWAELDAAGCSDFRPQVPSSWVTCPDCGVQRRVGVVGHGCTPSSMQIHGEAS